jgi:hypothetical protein
VVKISEKGMRNFIHVTWEIGGEAEAREAFIILLGTCETST